MRTVNDVIKYVNDIKPNAFTDDTLTEWLSECEGSIQTEILCIASGDVVTYNYADNKDTELIVKPPHDKLYGFYLLAMIDFAHGEYKKYENTMQLFNAALSEFAKWFVRTHSKEAKNPEGYYMSGYDLAVKHGYSGTEEEWLKTLIGPQGVQGIQGEKGDRGIPGKIQSVTSGDNGKILVDGESVVVYDDSEIKEEIGGKVDKAQGKGLSSNDYTAEEKTKLSELPTKTELDTDLSGKEDSANKVTTLDSNSTDTQYPSAKAVYVNISVLIDILRTKIDMDTLNYVVGFCESLSNKVTTLDSNSTDTQYPSAKCVNDKKADKTIITTVTEITSVPVLADNAELRFGELRALGLLIPITLYDGGYKSDSFISSVIFKSGANVPSISIRWEGDPTYPFDVYYQGADCKNGAFLPKANKRYTMIFSYDGIMNCYIAAVPIQTAETQSADDFPAANDESVADPTESVTEEPESEPNEVI